MRYPRRPFDRLNELPDGPGVYIVWSLISGWSGRPLYIGMTKRDVATRMREHVRAGDMAVPLFPGAAEVEFRSCMNGVHARSMERELIDRLDPYYGDWS